MRYALAWAFLVWLVGCQTTPSNPSSSPSTSATSPASKDTLSSSQASSSGAVAKIQFDKMEHDFGKIREGEKVSYRFRVKNPGTVPLRITDVKPSCGCTVPAWTKEPIPPGGEGFVEVIFDSQARSGEQIKTITVFANTDPPSHVLRFRGTVEPK
ncbi:MAG: DUF1573 domain-containing protein [Bacteroidia bacterium]|nr:DUF1573 domain-containing protein [Bacteroidia bacterium]MCX7764127.1 DUF1573 domain-containing protein [Bacteroidia bacterium]MDW8057554.1 DUF1573 domain-containing protein [Bacteroidia bacterium]